MFNGLISAGLLGCPVCGQPYRFVEFVWFKDPETGVITEYDALKCGCEKRHYIKGTERVVATGVPGAPKDAT